MQIKMEVNDLESFFLNKDKKKKSKKTYVINPSLLIEQTREAELKKAKKVNEKSQQSQEPKSELLRKTKEDDEWEDNVDVEVDISNLRIGMMPQKVEEQKPKVENNVECASEESDDDSNSKKNDKSSHPWGGNKVIMKSEIDTAPVVSSEVPSSQPQKYIPPSMRGGDANKMPSIKQSRRAPNITNNSEFPSLSEVADIDTEDGTWSRVNKNGHATKPQKSSSSDQQTTVKKSTIPSAKRDLVSPIDTVQSATAEVKSKPENPGKPKYVPPHIRKQNENRFAGLKDDSTR